MKEKAKGRRCSTLPLCLVLTSAVAVPALTRNPQTPAVAYQREFELWQQERIKDLKENWLPLIGLFWLEEGDNSFGSDKTNSIKLPAPSAPAKAGVLTLRGGEVVLEVADGVNLSSGGKPVLGREPVFSRSGRPTVLELGSLRMFIIQRGARYGLRVKDLNSTAIREFKGLQTYPLNEAYVVTADFVAMQGKTIAVTNVLGDVQQVPAPGELRFRLNGQNLRLVPTGSGRGRLSIVFSDLTKKNGTYPGGRFLDAEPAKDGKVVLDFNRAYSPPCAFTPYATCPLAPRENQLQVAIEAGEKYAGPH